MALENSERLFLVRTHQSRIFDDISAEDRRQPSLYPFLRQSPPPLSGYSASPSRRNAAPIGSQISARPVWDFTKPEIVKPGSSSGTLRARALPSSSRPSIDRAAACRT